MCQHFRQQLKVKKINYFLQAIDHNQGSLCIILVIIFSLFIVKHCCHCFKSTIISFKLLPFLLSKLARDLQEVHLISKKCSPLVRKVREQRDYD